MGFAGGYRAGRGLLYSGDRFIEGFPFFRRKSWLGSRNQIAGIVQYLLPPLRAVAPT